MNRSSNAIWAIADQGILSATRFLITFLIGKFAVEGQLGVYSLAFSILIFLTTIQESLMTTPYQIFYPRVEGEQRKSLAGNLLLTSLGMSLVGSLLLILATIVWPYFDKIAAFGNVLAVLAFCLPFHLIREFVRRWQFVHDQVRSITIMDGLYTVLQISGLLVLLALQRLNADSAMAMTGIASLLFCGIAFFRYRSDLSFAKDRLKSDTLRNVKYGGWITFSSLCSVAQTYFANWYLAFILTPRDADAYTVCATMSLLANPFLLGISSLHGPQASRAFVEQGIPGVMKTIAKTLVWVCLILGLYTAMLGVFGEWFAVVVFGKSYEGLRWPILILSISILGQGVNYIISNGLCAVNFPHLDLVAALIGLIASVVVSLSLEPSVLNASIGFLSGVIAMAIFRISTLLWISSRHTHRAMS